MFEFLSITRNCCCCLFCCRLYWKRPPVCWTMTSTGPWHTCVLPSPGGCTHGRTTVTSACSSTRGGRACRRKSLCSGDTSGAAESDSKQQFSQWCIDQIILLLLSTASVLYVSLLTKPAVSLCAASCGHLYHLQCLQQKECVWGVASADPQQRWSCYKCSSSRAGKGGPAIEPRRGRSSTQAQVSICMTAAEPRELHKYGN